MMVPVIVAVIVIVADVASAWRALAVVYNSNNDLLCGSSRLIASFLASPLFVVGCCLLEVRFCCLYETPSS